MPGENKQISVRLFLGEIHPFKTYVENTHILFCYVGTRECIYVETYVLTHVRGYSDGPAARTS